MQRVSPALCVPAVSAVMRGTPPWRRAAPFLRTDVPACLMCCPCGACVRSCAFRVSSAACSSRPGCCWGSRGRPCSAWGSVGSRPGWGARSPSHRPCHPWMSAGATRPADRAHIAPVRAAHALAVELPGPGAGGALPARTVQDSPCGVFRGGALGRIATAGACLGHRGAGIRDRWSRRTALHPHGMLRRRSGGRVTGPWSALARLWPGHLRAGAWCFSC